MPVDSFGGCVVQLTCVAVPFLPNLSLEQSWHAITSMGMTTVATDSWGHADAVFSDVGLHTTADVVKWTGIAAQYVTSVVSRFAL